MQEKFFNIFFSQLEYFCGIFSAKKLNQTGQIGTEVPQIKKKNNKLFPEIQ